MLQDKSREIIKFRHTLKGFSSKTLAAMLKELQRSEILERKSYNETPPRVEYNLTNKRQLVVATMDEEMEFNLSFYVEKINAYFKILFHLL